MVKKTHRIKKRNKGNKGSKGNKSIRRRYLKKTKKRIYYGGKKLTPSQENVDAIPVNTPSTPDMRLLSSKKGTSSGRGSVLPPPTTTPLDNDDDKLSDLERRLAILKGDDSLNTTPVINSPFHIPEYKRKPDEQNSRLKSPNFESQDVVLSETYENYNSFSSEDDKQRTQLTAPLPSSFQVIGYDKHPFFSHKNLPDMTGKKLPSLTNKINLTIDAHGSVGHILNDNEKRLANHYLRIIEIGDYDGTVSVYRPEYYKILNDMLRNPNYAELFDDTHVGKQLRTKAYKKLCPFIKDSRNNRSQ